jgi:hypothetical protein
LGIVLPGGRVSTRSSAAEFGLRARGAGGSMAGVLERARLGSDARGCGADAERFAERLLELGR